MCQNVSKLYYKFAAGIFLATILGIVAGVTLPAFPARPVVFLSSELITSSLVILFWAIYLLYKPTKGCQAASALKNYIGYFLTGAVGGFITSIIGLSSVVAQTTAYAVLLGFAVGFFVLLLFGFVYTLGYLLNLVS